MRRIDYQKRYNELLRKNIANVRSSIDSRDMKTKIRNYALKYDVPYAFVRRKILTDNIFALGFAKDPSKQSYNQTLALEFISENPLVLNPRQLPAGGSDALYVINGVLKDEKTMTPDDKALQEKSIDFYWETLSNSGILYHIYASHKYTKEEGGAQDNQYHDLCKFMKNAMASTEQSNIFLAIADGQYYQKTMKDGVRRIDYMNHTFGGERCIALTVDDIDALIDQIKTS